MTKQAPKLDEILAKLAGKYSDMPILEDEVRGEESFADARQAIAEAIEQIIGEDELETEPGGVVYVRNKLRKEQRQRLNKILGE